MGRKRYKTFNDLVFTPTGLGGTAEQAKMEFGRGRYISVLRGTPAGGFRIYTGPSTYEVGFQNGDSAPFRVRGWRKSFQVTAVMRRLQREVAKLECIFGDHRDASRGGMCSQCWAEEHD